MPARESTSRRYAGGLLFFCFAVVTAVPALGQNIIWRGNGDPNFYSVVSNWDGLGGTPDRVPTINDDILFSAGTGIYPNPDTGIQIFPNLAVNGIRIEAGRNVALRPEGRYSVVDRTDINGGSLRILNFSNQTAFTSNLLTTTNAGFSVTGGAFASSNSTSFTDSSVDIAGSYLSGATSLRGSTLSIASGGRFDQFTGGLDLVDSAQVDIAAGGSLTVRSAGSMLVTNNSLVNVSGQLTVDGIFVSFGTTRVLEGGHFQRQGRLNNLGLTVVEGGQLTVEGFDTTTGTRPVFFSHGSIRVTGVDGYSGDQINGGSLRLDTNDRFTVDHRLSIGGDQSIALRTSDNLRAGSISLLGGTISASAGPIDVSAISADNRITGRGTIRGAITGNSDAAILTSGGNLVLDSLGQSSENDFAGVISSGNHTLAVLNSEMFTLGRRTTLNLGGRLISTGGLELLTDTTLDADGFTTIGGRFVNNGTVNASAIDGEFLTFTDDVSGSGSYTGNIVFSDAFDPGNSAGEVSFENVMFDDSSTLSIELGGLMAGDEHDLLSISGDAMLGGSLAVSLIDGFMLGEGQLFNFFNVDGVIGGQFTGLGEGDLVGNFGGTDLFITYAGGDGNDVSLFTAAAVPEPSSLALLTVIGLGIAHRRRRYTLNVLTPFSLR